MRKKILRGLFLVMIFFPVGLNAADLAGDEFSSIEEDFSALKQELNNSLTDNQKLQNQYTASLQQLNDSFLKLKGCEAKLTAALAERLDLQSQLDNFKSKFTSLQVDSTLKIKDYEARLKDLEKLKSQSQNWQSQSQSLSGSIQQLTNAIQEKEKIIASLKADSLSLAKEQTAQLKNIELNAVIADKEKIISGLKQQQQQLAAQVKAFEPMLAQSQNELTSRVKNYNANLKHLQDDYALKLKDCEAKLASAFTEKAACSSQLETLKSQSQNWQSQSQSLSGSIQQLTNIAAEKEKLIKEVKVNAESLTKKQTDTLIKFKEYETKLAASLAEKTNLQVLSDNLKIKEQVAQAKNAKLVAAIGEKEKSIIQAKQEQQQLLAQIKALELKLAQSQDNQALKTKNYEDGLKQLEDENTGKLKNCQAKIIDLTDESGTRFKDYEAKLFQMQSEKNTLQLQLDALKTQSRDWQPQSQLLSGSIGQLTSAIGEKEKIIAGLKVDLENLAKKETEALDKLKVYEAKLSVSLAANADLQARLAVEKNNLRESLLKNHVEQLWFAKEYQDKSALIEKEKQDLENQVKRFSMDSLKGRQDYTVELKGYEDKISQLQDEQATKLKEYEVNLARVISEKQALAGQLETLKSQSQDWQSQGQSLSGSVSQLTNTIQEKEKIVSELKQQYQQLVSQIEDYKNTVSRLKDEQARAEQAREDFQTKEESYISQIKQYTDQINAVNAEKDSLTGKINDFGSLSASLGDKDKAIIGLKQNEQGLLAKQGELALLVKDYEDKFAFLQGEKAALQSQLNDFKFKEQGYQAKIDEFNSVLAGKEKNILEAKQREKELAGAQDSSAFKVQGYEVKLSKLENERNNLLLQIRDLQDKEANWQAKNDELSGLLKTRERETLGLKQTQEDLSGQLQNAQGGVKAERKIKAELLKKNEALAKDNNLLRQKVESYPAKLSQVALLKDRLLKENAVLHYNLGVFHIQRQEYNEAISEFEKVLELNPADTATHYNLGVIYAEYLSDRPKAIVHFKRYLNAAGKDDKDTERAKKYILTWDRWEAVK